MVARLLRFIPGVNEEPDETEQNTRRIIMGNNIRFFRGAVQKIGGHAESIVDTIIQGCPRAVFSFTDASNNTWSVVGTHQKLYAKQGTTVYNITPLKTTSVALATDPFALTSGDATMTVTLTDHNLTAGDRIKFAGATHGTGGFATTNLNIEHIVATVINDDTFTVELPNVAPATDSTEGGAAVVIYYEIDPGSRDAAAASGVGIGTPGLGLPGSIQTNTSLIIQPRIWWQDAFGDKWVGGAGRGGKCYEWDGDTSVAPTVISGSPDADWGWIEDAKLVTLLGNRVKNSDAGNLTAWTPGAASSAYEDDKEDAKKLIGRVFVNGENLIFADENKVFRMRWVGGTIKWVWEMVSDTIGVTSPSGSITVGNISYIFAKENLYFYNGGIIAPLPDNTVVRKMFDNLNLDQRYKCFVWFNQKFNELWFHYPTGIENDRCTIYSLTEGHFTPRIIDRTAADSEGQISQYPILTDSNGIIYRHEIGFNDNGAAMESYFMIAYEAIAGGEFQTYIEGMEPDLIQTGDLTIELYGKDRATFDGALIESFTFAEGDGKIDCANETRWRSWKITSNTLDGYFRTGGMLEHIQQGSAF